MFPQVFIAGFLILHLRKKLRNFSPHPEWEKTLTILLYADIALLVGNNLLHRSFIMLGLADVLVLALLYFMYKKPVFASSRTVFVAVLPIGILFTVKDLVMVLHSTWLDQLNTYVDFAIAVAVTWMIAMLVVSHRQQKALLKERQIREAENEQNRIIALRKAELEALVDERTAELTQQKDALQHALTDLKAMQAQLVQSEKMASLGELTAGIAHEIQNPLNFVNNFSEINSDLIAELKHEITKGNIEETISLANDIEANGQKILQHGKRADGIVKGMLQHSRKNTGQKEATDLNALCDEYLRLAYHGLRAKDKSFNADFKMDFDDTIGKIKVVPQDIGRVLLNLFNNAFYAVDEQKKKLNGSYHPKVTVRTKKIGNKIEIQVADNGMGISKSLIDKIFQPFFTTKPTGQGTGLGLSLSYDIIKAHSGEITVESNEQEGTTFTVILPIGS
jgi:two-component system, NtrC family, sensor kinase